MNRAAKYRSLSHDASGQPIVWPGTPEGFPFRGEVKAPVKQQEWEETPHEFDVHTEVLTLPGQMERYDEILDKVANGLWLLRRETPPSYNPTTGTYHVMITWLEPYGTPPTPRSRYDHDIDDSRRREDPKSFFFPWALR